MFSHFGFLDQLGLNFYAINLKFLEIVDNYMAYYLWKFHIDSLQIVISTNFVISKKYFHIFLRCCVYGAVFTDVI